MIEIGDLKKQIESTIKALELKKRSSGEPVIDDYIHKYQSVLSFIQSGEPRDVVIKKSQSILNCVRGYMETSSDYQQEFLKEMGNTEKIIKQL